MNMSGPRKEPWGIPQVTILADDLCPSTVQDCFLFRKYEVNQSPVIPLTPYFSGSLARYCGRLYQILFRSRKVAKLTSFLSMVEYQESVLVINDVIVEYNLRKAAWFFVNIG